MSNFDPFGNNQNNDKQQGNDPFGNNQGNDKQGGYDPFGNTPGNGQQNGQQYYGQQPPYGQPPYGQPPFGYPPQQPDDRDGKNAKLYGIIALILNFLGCCLPAGIVLGILAIVRAGSSRKMLGYQSDDARLGKVLGIISVVWSAISVLFIVLYVVFVVAIGILGAAGGGTVV